MDAGDILRELVDAHLRIELPHVRRIAVAFRTERGDLRAPEGCRRGLSGVTCRTRRSSRRMNVIGEGGACSRFG
jgi:hypothetical protein